MRSVLVLATLGSCGRVDFAAQTDAGPPIAAQFEAESGQLAPSFAVFADTAASGGKYVQDTNPDGITGAGSVRFAFTLPDQATYFLWARTISTTDATDSFFVDVDATGAQPFDTSECFHGAGFHWIQLRDFSAFCPNVGVRLPFSLAAGGHQLVLTSREGGSIIDRMLFTEDGTYVPTD